MHGRRRRRQSGWRGLKWKLRRKGFFPKNNKYSRNEEKRIFRMSDSPPLGHRRKRSFFYLRHIINERFTTKRTPLKYFFFFFLLLFARSSSQKSYRKFHQQQKANCIQQQQSTMENNSEQSEIRCEIFSSEKKLAKICVLLTLITIATINGEGDDQ